MADDYNAVFSAPDPRKFVVVHCDNKAQLRRNQLDQTKSTGLISGLRKIAGIEGTGIVQEGLSAIVKTVGVGGQEWERMVESGTTGILSTVMGDQATNVLSEVMQKVNPGAINKGISQAKIIHGKVKDRDFNWRDIPQYVADFKNLYEIGSTIIDPFLAAQGGPDVTHTMCSASPYAMDLVQQGVKFKFLFVVEIKFNTEYANMLGVEPSFVVKTADRPSVTYDYEDLNLYNMRTKVAKKSTFTPVSMTFHDDEQNRAVAFYNAMQRLMSPIANHLTPALYEQTGMDFRDIAVDATGKDSGAQGIGTMDHAASIGPLIGTNTSIIQSINLYHVYFGGAKVNEYVFRNPRILNMSLDGLDMSAEGTTELKIEFAYDNVEISNYMTPGAVVEKDTKTGAKYPLGRANWGPTYPASTTIPNSGTVVTSGSKSGFPIAEAFSRGESFVEGLVGGAKDIVGSAVGSVANAATAAGKWVQSAATGVSVQDYLQAEEYKKQFPKADPRLHDPATQYSVTADSSAYLYWKEKGMID